MATVIDREGNFRARPTEWGLLEQDSGAVAVSLRFSILAEFNEQTGEWDDWTQYDVEAYGDFYIIKRDGTVSEKQVAALSKALGWDANPLTIRDPSWQPNDCVVCIKADTYKDETRYKASWVNPYEWTPSGMGNVDDERLKALAAQYGSQLRAAAGPQSTAAKPPATRPAPPKQPIAASAGGGHAAITDADIPFAPGFGPCYV